MDDQNRPQPFPDGPQAPPAPGSVGPAHGRDWPAPQGTVSARPGQPVYAPPSAYAPPGAYGSLAEQGRGSRVLAITALSIAIPASLLALVPFVGRFFTLAVLAAIVVAIVALVMRKPGTGMSITAIVVSVLVGIVAPAALFLMRAGFIAWGLFSFIRDST